MIAPPYPQGYTPSLVFTQPRVEQVLRARIAEMPTVTVELGVEMRAIRQDGSGVTLEIGDATAATHEVTARYAIGCDGGSSKVRAQLDLALDDLDFDEPWLVVDVLVNDQGLRKLPAVSVQYCEPERPCTLVIGPGNHRRWEISLKAGEDPRVMAQDSETWKLLSRWLTPEDGELWRQASYRFHALVANQWRKDRVFLAGDAAHMQPPFLGQGMCQGVRDAANLAWKLAAVLRDEVQGQAAQHLLDSYGAERKAHVSELTRRIKAVGAVICERDPGRARARDAQLLAECAGQVRDTSRQDILPRLEPGFLSAQTHAARGTLFPQPWLTVAGAAMRMDAHLHNGWRLVLAREVALEIPATPLLDTLHLAQVTEREGVLRDWFARHGCVAALLRPDNYVFGVAPTRADIEALIDERTSMLELPTALMA